MSISDFFLGPQSLFSQITSSPDSFLICGALSGLAFYACALRAKLLVTIFFLTLPFCLFYLPHPWRQEFPVASQRLIMAIWLVELGLLAVLRLFRLSLLFWSPAAKGGHNFFYVGFLFSVAAAVALYFEWGPLVKVLFIGNGIPLLACAAFCTVTLSLSLIKMLRMAFLSLCWGALAIYLCGFTIFGPESQLYFNRARATVMAVLQDAKS